MTLTFKFGKRAGSYSGQINPKGLPQGKGSFTTKNKDNITWTYTGEWKNGHKAGKGSTVWANGWAESGTYKNDLLQGQGTKTKNAILRYQGNFKNGLHNGNGILYNSLGQKVYQGKFENGYLVETGKARSARLKSFMNGCKEISYKKYKNDIDSYIGTKIMLTGQIFYFYKQDKGDEYFCEMLMYDQGKSNNIVDVIYTYSKGEKAFKDNEWVTVWGNITGTYTYTAEDKNKRTAVIVDARNIKPYEP